MIEKILLSLFLTVLFLLYYVFEYLGPFGTCIGDDVDFNGGRHTLKRVLKAKRGFWRRFIYWDVRNKINKWHYFLFWSGLMSYTIFLIFLNIYVLFDLLYARICFLVFFGVNLTTVLCISLVRRNLYKGNVIRSKKKYRKKG